MVTVDMNTWSMVTRHEHLKHGHFRYGHLVYGHLRRGHLDYGHFASDMDVWANATSVDNFGMVTSDMDN